VQILSAEGRLRRGDRGLQAPGVPQAGRAAVALDLDRVDFEDLVEGEKQRVHGVRAEKLLGELLKGAKVARAVRTEPFRRSSVAFPVQP